VRSMADGYVCANFPRSVFLKRDGDGVGGDNNPSKYSNSSVRYFDGVVQLAWTDLRSDGFGAVCDQRRSWSNGDYNPLDSNLRPRSDNGTGMVVEQLPYLTGHIGRGPTVVVITSATSVRFYDAIFSANDWLARFYTKDQLTFTNGELVLTDTAGNQIHFYDTFGGPVNPRWGKFKSMTDPDGNITTVTGWTDDGKAAEVQRSTPVGQTPHVVESFVCNLAAPGRRRGLERGTGMLDEARVVGQNCGRERRPDDAAVVTAQGGNTDLHHAASGHDSATKRQTTRKHAMLGG